MAETLAYTDLLTPTEVVADGMKSAAVNEADDHDEIIRAIRDVTGVVEDEVKRELIVRSHTLRFQRGVWRPEPGYTLPDATATTFVAFAPAWPVVQIVSVDGSASLASEVSILDGGRRLGFTFDDLTYAPTYVTAFCGYRRSDQTLAGLQSDLAALTALPEKLPGAIRSAALELVLYRLSQAEGGLFGRGRRMQQVGGGSMATVEAPDVGFEQRVLSRLSRGHKVLV